jgi:hypothetical protein
LFGALSSYFIIYDGAIRKIGSGLAYYYVLVYTFVSKKWHFDQISNKIIVHRAMGFGYSISFMLFDKGLIESFGPFGVSQSSLTFSKGIATLQSGFLFHYAFLFGIGALSCLALFVFIGFSTSQSLLFWCSILLFTYCFFSSRYSLR